MKSHIGWRIPVDVRSRVEGGHTSMCQCIKSNEIRIGLKRQYSD